MRAVVQRVTRACVRVGERITGEIAEGLLVFAGVERDDGPADVTYIAEKVHTLRVFEDDAGKMNRSLDEAGGAVLVVSQFTLCGDCRKGRRPSFDAAETPASANVIYESLVADLQKRGVRVQTGEFQADMRVELVNDGPVTLLLDSRKRW